MSLSKSKFHFVGIGGIGMCGLAELLFNIGATVSGSDLSENANTEHLKKLGVKIFKGHQAENLGEVDVVVYSSAVPVTNPEVRAAHTRGIPLIPRAEALAELMRLKRGIAVAGTHGKTTTTSMTASIFLAAKAQPTIVVGGRLDLIQSTAKLGSGEWLIAEADESDGSFQKLSPEIAIITNIDSDHLDHFKNFENVRKAFLKFSHQIPFYGSVIVWGDDPQTRKLFEGFPKRVLFYGFEEANDFSIRGERGVYKVFKKKEELGILNIKIPGRHNALNALAASICALQAGLKFSDCQIGLEQFAGVDRRFHFKGEANGIPVYDDYGHHPTEITATLQGFREKFPDRRLVVLFQPHRFTRTQHSWHEFLNCFKDCDELVITDIYPAGEAPIAGITSEKLAKEVKIKNARYIAKTDLFSGIGKNKLSLEPGSVVLTLGAGDIWKVGMDLLGKNRPT